MWHIQHLQSDPIHHLLTREHLARGLWRRSHVNLTGNLAGEVTHFVRAAMAPQNASTASRRRRTSPPAPVCDAQSASSGSSRIPRNQNTVDAPTPPGPVLSTRARIEMLCANNSKEKENGTKDSVLVLAHRHVVCCCSCAARPRMLRKCHAGVCVCVCG